MLKKRQAVSYSGKGRVKLRRGACGVVLGALVNRGRTYYRVKFGERLFIGMSASNLAPLAR